MAGAAATNNQGLLYAAELTLDPGPASSPRENLTEDAGALFRALDDVFRPYELSPLLGGYTRLSNTALAIPVNDIQLALDDLYGQLLDFDAAYDRLGSELSELRTRHWDSRGGIPCDSADSVEDNFSEQLMQALDTRGQMAPVRKAIHRGDNCLSNSINARIAIEAIGEESFRTALRTAIAIRRQMASILAWQRGFAMTIRLQLEAYLPGITLPIDTLGIVGSATPAEWDPGRAIPMRRKGPHDWMIQISLGEGEVKFLANRE